MAHRYYTIIQNMEVQKPADKVEPNFKVEKDKWYVCVSQYCNCIEGRNYKASLDGRIIDDYGTEYDMHSDAYRWFRPWTIQDAEDGDVLSYRNGQWISILKRRIDKDSFEYYTLWSTIHNDLTINDSTFSLLINSIYPATKEQRDLLFQKMHEAGYTFNFEKKELKKIEQKPATWSEEDELYIRELESLVKQVWATAEHKNDKDTIHKMSDLSFFLKTLKPQLKQEWSEEDDKKRKGLIKGLEDRMGFGWASDPFSREEYISWLKSLRHQSQWKPSEEQMEALDRAQAELCSTEYNKPICDLIDSLNKLREE